MQIKIISGTVASGAVRRAGNVLDVSSEEARLLINAGKAVPFDESRVPAKTKKSPVNRMEKADVTR